MRFVAVRCMLYGFGDDESPYQETVYLLEELVIQFIVDMVGMIYLLCAVCQSPHVRQTRRAQEIGKPGRIAVEDILYLVRHDLKKYSRVNELLMMNEELKRARKAFDEVKYFEDGGKS